MENQQQRRVGLIDSGRFQFVLICVLVGLISKFIIFPSYGLGGLVIMAAILLLVTVIFAISSNSGLRTILGMIFALGMVIFYLFADSQGWVDAAKIFLQGIG